MYKKEKVAFGQKVLEKSSNYTCALVYEKKPIKATEMDNLRRNIRNNEGKVQIGGNLIVSKALAETRFAQLSEKLKGSNIIIFFNDALNSGRMHNQVKLLKDKLAFKMALIEDGKYSEKEFASIARFDSRKTAMAYMLCSMNSPISCLARLLKQYYDIIKEKEGQK